MRTKMSNKIARIMAGVLAAVIVGTTAIGSGIDATAYTRTTGTITVTPQIDGQIANASDYDGKFDIYKIASVNDDLTTNFKLADEFNAGYTSWMTNTDYQLTAENLTNQAKANVIATRLRDYIDQKGIACNYKAGVSAGQKIEGVPAGIYLIKQGSYDSSKWEEATPGIIVMPYDKDWSHDGESDWDVTVLGKLRKKTSPPDTPGDEEEKTNIHISTGKTVISKYDSEDGHVLSGVVFNLYKADGTVVGQYSTDSDGQLYVDGLPMGNYYFREVQAQDGYILDGTHINFTVRNTWDTATNMFSNTPSQDEGGNGGEEIGNLDDNGNMNENGNLNEGGALTGDNSQMMLYGAVAGVAAVLLIVWFVARRKNNRNEK